MNDAIRARRLSHANASIRSSISILASLCKEPASLKTLPAKFSNPERHVHQLESIAERLDRFADVLVNAKRQVPDWDAAVQAAKDWLDAPEQDRDVFEPPTDEEKAAALEAIGTMGVDAGEQEPLSEHEIADIPASNTHPGKPCVADAGEAEEVDPATEPALAGIIEPPAEAEAAPSAAKGRKAKK
jgi:hypothetical protein